MSQKISLGADGVVTHRANKPSLPRLQVVPTTKSGKRLVRLHRLISGSNPLICLERGGGIGDLLMTTPVARFIKEQYPNVKLTYAVDTKYLDGALPAVLEGNPYVDDIIEWNTTPESEFDAVINLHCPCVAHEQPLAKPVSRMILFARHAGIPSLKNVLPVYTISKEEIEWAKSELERKLKLQSHHKILMLNPFASNQNRSLNPNIIKKAVSSLRKMDKNLKVIVITHESDYERDILWDSISDHVFNNYAVRQIAALMKLSDVLVCPDSALLHLSAAIDVKAVTLFGPTDARARVIPYPNAKAVWPGGQLKCAPCWYTSGKCNHKTCWKLIEVSDIINIVKSRLGEEIKSRADRVRDIREYTGPVRSWDMIRTEIL